MPALKPMTTINTMLGQTARVLDYIGGGGQGDVYEIIYAGQHKALKWYHPEAIHAPKQFVRNLRNNISRGRPTDEFLWPIDLTAFYEGSFGYIMDLRPEGYAEVDDFLLNRVSFPSYRRVVDACLDIVKAFGILHDKGYAYQDINSKNFFISADKGKVLICDNDNVAPDGTSTGIQGTWGYMAPEVVRGGLPNTQSDLHSLAVILFLLLFKVHPLEGLATVDSLMSEYEKVRIYGKEPLFVFDEHDHRNCLDPLLQEEAILLWAELPDYLRALFKRVFSQEALRDARYRPLEIEWMEALARFRSEIQTCDCGRCEVVLPADGVATCEACGVAMSADYVIDTGRVTLPALYDTRIYRCQIQLANPIKALDLMGWIVRSNREMGSLGLLNMSDETWHVLIGDGGAKDVLPHDGILIQDGMRVTCDHIDLTIRSAKGEV